MNLIELNSKNQKQLFNFDNIFLNVVNLHDKKKLPNKILFSGPKGSGKATFAYHLINYIFSKKEKYSYNLNKFEINELNRSYNLVLNNDLSKITLKSFLVNLITEKHYKKDFFIKNNIFKFIEFYLLNLMKFKNSRNKISSLYSNFIYKIHNLKKFNLDDESFFIEFKSKVLDE